MTRPSRTYLVDPILRSCRDADPPSLTTPAPMLLFLKFGQPFHHWRNPIRGRILQAHREQVVVYGKQHLFRAIRAGYGELDASEWEQGSIRLSCKKRDHAWRLLERIESANCMDGDMDKDLEHPKAAICGEKTHWDWVCEPWRLERETMRKLRRGER
jgi:hypothetical protein